MNIITKSITVRNEELILTNQRALYWANEDALILSDLHIGKTAHFRKHGIPMPNDILQADLERLKTLINHFNAHKLIVVGDLFHAEANLDLDTFKDWVSQFDTLKITLIKGNHDRLSKNLINKFKIEVELKKQLHPFTFVHEHQENLEEDFIISGHTHPGVLVKGMGKQKLKLPCYQVTSNQIILPAFSLFTGLNTRNKPDNAICYAFTETSFFTF